MARRGEVWLVDFGTPVGHEQGHRRPAVVVSDDRLNRSRAELVIVIPTTTTRRGLPSHVEFEPDDGGLRETSYARVEDVKSVSTQGSSAASARFWMIGSTAPNRCSAFYSACKGNGIAAIVLSPYQKSFGVHVSQAGGASRLIQIRL